MDDAKISISNKDVINKWIECGGVLWVDRYPEPKLYTETDEQIISKIYSERDADFRFLGKTQYLLHLAKEAMEWAGVDKERANEYLLQSLRGLSLKGVLKCTGMTQQALADRFGIPKRTIENWSSGASACPSYTLRMIKEIILVGACR